MRRRLKLFLGFATIFVAWILLAPFCASFLIVDAPLEKADAIWVLGGSGSYLERTHEAAKLFTQGVAPKIFVVNDGGYGGWNKIEQKNLAFHEISRRELIAQGVAAEAIEVLPDEVTGTNWEADLFAKVAQKYNLKSILLVDSIYHSRRTLWTFDKSVLKNNLQVRIGIDTAPADAKTPGSWWWLSFKGWQTIGEEYVKFAYYWVSY